VLKLGKLTDYATLVMTELASGSQQPRSAQELAARSHVAAPTVAKLLRLLARAQLVVAERGVHGGYRLTRAPASISVADIVAAVEGPVAVTECAGVRSCCAIEHHCGVRGHWRSINTAIERALASVTLAQMCAERQGVGHESALPLHRAAAPGLETLR